MVIGSRGIRFVVKLFILLLLITTSLKAEDYSWSIEKINEKNVMVSMNGQIQHGDRLYFYIPSANCNKVENLFTFYTAANNSNLTNLQDKPLAIKINDNELYGDVRFMFPMLMGHQVWISIGNYDLDTHIDFLKSYEKFDYFEFRNASNLSLEGSLVEARLFYAIYKSGVRLIDNLEL